MGEQTNQPLTGDQIEQVIRLSLPTVREAVRAEMQPVVARVDAIEIEVTTLKTNWANVSRGRYAVTSIFSVIGTLLSSSVLDLVRGKQ